MKPDKAIIFRGPDLNVSAIEGLHCSECQLHINKRTVCNSQVAQGQSSFFLLTATAMQQKGLVLEKKTCNTHVSVLDGGGKVRLHVTHTLLFWLVHVHTQLQSPPGSSQQMGGWGSYFTMTLSCSSLKPNPSENA